jgi:starch-binding outer membrane protein, SusD/RagB family
MKYHKTSVVIKLIISILIFTTSCNSNKLELLNPNELNVENWFKNESQVRSAVNAAYCNLQTRGLYQTHMYYSMDNMSYENLPNPEHEVDKMQYFQYSFDAKHPGIEAYWASCYLGINKANFVINNEDKINEIPENKLSQIRKRKYIGEAEFLRALYYFLLVTRFGDIPLVTNSNDNGLGVPKSPTTLIWAQIEKDLTFAAANCLSRANEEKGRATSGAAWALLGKAHLFQASESHDPADYEAAKTAFLKVTNDPAYYLESRYLNNFEEETEHGPESLFEVEFNATLGNDDRWSSDRAGTGLNEATFRGQEYGCFDWFNVYPSPDLANEFEPGDPRYHYCFYVPGDVPKAGNPGVIIHNAVVYNNGKDTAAIYPREIYSNGNFISVPIVGWRKYQNYYKQRSESSVAPQASGINMKVIRYADVLLMMAECEANLGNLATAVSLMNQVRARADVNMSPYPTNEYLVSNLAEFMITLEHERKVELCGEQVRFNDLVRWRRLEAFVKNVPKLSYIEATFQFDPNKHYLWPIPQAEINLNRALTQADQNPGY